MSRLKFSTVPFDKSSRCSLITGFVGIIRTCFFLFAAALLVACGDDGDQGVQGEVGAPGKPGADPVELVATFSAATVSEEGTLQVSFTLVDEDGWPYPYLQSNNARFAVVKLNAAGALGAGETSSWQSYINRTETAPTDSSNGTGNQDTVQATTESSGELVNNGDGSYTYTYETNLKTVSSPIVVSYDSGATHRVAIQISGGDLPVANATYDWLPDTGETSNILTRNMVDINTCNSCHGELALHGGGRVDANYCVTCHNPGTVDANSGNTVDFKVMIHKIHRGANLPSVVAGGEYAIWGFRDSKHDYSEVHFPQDVRQCRNCHDENNDKTPDASNWIKFPTIEACGSCHDDVNFSTGENHVAGARTNEECSSCHTGDESNQLRTDYVHDISGLGVAKDKLAVRVDETSLDPTNNDVQLKFSLVNPSDDTVYTEAAGDINFIGRARIYRNPVDLSTGYTDSFNYFNIEDLTPDASGQYSLDTDIIPASDQLLAFSTRMRVCTSPKSGELLDCDDESAENAGVTAVWGNVDQTGSLLSASNELQMGAEFERCATCHADATIGVHGGDYSSLQQCRACHNNSFLRDSGNLDLKFIIHAYHASNLDDGEGGKAPMHYPDDVQNCTQCHSTGQLDLPIAANKWAPETSEGAYTSPTAFICASCHLTTQPGAIDTGNLSALSETDQSLVGHMIQNGAVFNGSQSAANVTESCAVCHSSGSLSAIDEVHELKE